MKNVRRNNLDVVGCKNCGKKFIPAASHIYRDKNKPAKIYCSYSCWKKAGYGKGYL